jgi:hypothetical protein
MFGHKTRDRGGAGRSRAAHHGFNKIGNHMSTQRMLGIVVAILGVILLVIGMNSSHSVADQVSNTFSGRFTERTTWYIIGGIVLAGFGLVLVLFGGGAKPLLTRRGS